VLAHESSKSQKIMFETVETRYSGLANQRVQFYRDRWQSGTPSTFDEVLLLRPSDVGMKKNRES
jgi:hypothetical protein